MQISFVFLWKNMEIKPWLPKKSQKTPNTQTKKTQPKTTRKKKIRTEKNFNTNTILKKWYTLFKKSKVYKCNRCKLL